MQVTTYRVRFEGPVGLALRVATALADADGVVDGLPDDVIAAVGGVRGWLPNEATIEIVMT